MALINAKDAAAASFEESVEHSRFDFKGTVTKVNAATLPQIRPTASTIIVKVDELVSSSSFSRRVGCSGAASQCVKFTGRNPSPIYPVGSPKRGEQLPITSCR